MLDMKFRNLIAQTKKGFLSLLSLSFLATGCSNNESTNDSNKSDNNTDSNQAIEVGSGSTLVVYFSVTNNTKKVAEYAKEYLQSDIFEIIPKEKYTSEDIDYNSDCRANREQNDDTARPEIEYTISDISKYDTIVLGYPIWWGQAPKIMYTFIESYNFERKTILPFCTSGSSSIGSSATNLAKSAPKANWLEGRRFPGNVDKSTITSWLDENIKKEVTMNLYIDNNKLDVSWEVNPSVSALKELSKNTLTINMHEYGGFEQTGNIGQSIVKNDKDINTVAGDIVLYQGNQISVFYNSSSWSYTKLGHINLSNDELNNLLNKESVVFLLKGE